MLCSFEYVYFRGVCISAEAKLRCYFVGTTQLGCSYRLGFCSLSRPGQPGNELREPPASASPVLAGMASVSLYPCSNFFFLKCGFCGGILTIKKKFFLVIFENFTFYLETVSYIPSPQMFVDPLFPVRKISF